MVLMCVNLLAVLSAAAATMVIGFLWYSPLSVCQALDDRDGIRP